MEDTLTILKRTPHGTHDRFYYVDPEKLTPETHAE